MNTDEVPEQRKIAVFLAGFGAFLNVYAPQALLPTLAKTFHLSPAQASLTITVTTLAVAMTAPWVGFFSDRLGRRRIIVPALFALAVPTALAGCVLGFEQLLAVRFLQGLIVPAVFGVMVAYIGEESDAHHTGALMSIYSAGTVLGGFTGRFLSGAIADRLGWRASFFVIGLLLLGTAFAVRRFLPQERNFRPNLSLDAPRVLARQLRQPSVLATSFVGFSVLFALVAGFTYANFHLAAPPWNLGASALGSIFVVYLLGLVTIPIAGQLIDRIGPKSTVLAALSLGAAGILVSLLPAMSAVVAGLALLSTAAFVAQVGSNVYLVRRVAGSRSTSTGIYYAFYYLGGSLGAFLPGFLWLRAGWAGTVALVFVVEILAMVLVYRFWEGREKKLAGHLGLQTRFQPLLRSSSQG